MLGFGLKPGVPPTDVIYIIIAAVACAGFPALLPEYDGERLKMNIALMIIFCKSSPKKAVSGAVWQSGMVALVAIYGIEWMADTLFSNYMTEIHSVLEGVVKAHPGGCCRVHAASCIWARYPGLCSSWGPAVRLWLFFHSGLSVGYSNCEFRQDGNDKNRKISAEPFVHDAGNDMPDSIDRRFISSGDTYLLAEDYSEIL